MSHDGPGDADGRLEAGQLLSARDSLLRRIPDDPNMFAVDQATGATRPSSGAFKPDADGVSAYSEMALGAEGLSPSALFLRSTGALARLPVGSIRRIAGLDAVGDPWPRDVPDHPTNAAHALITGMAGISKGARLDLQKAIAEMPGLSIVRPLGPASPTAPPAS